MRHKLTFEYPSVVVKPKILDGIKNWDMAIYVSNPRKNIDNCETNCWRIKYMKKPKPKKDYSFERTRQEWSSKGFVGYKK